MKGYLDSSYICDLLDITPQTLSYKIRTDIFPEADLIVAKKYFWKVETIISYLDTKMYRYESLILKIENDVK